jgi:hypothetical protein
MLHQLPAASVRSAPSRRPSADPTRNPAAVATLAGSLSVTSEACINEVAPIRAPRHPRGFWPSYSALGVLPIRECRESDLTKPGRITLAAPRGLDDPQCENLTHYGWLTSVVKLAACVVERVCYRLSGGIVKLPRPNEIMNMCGHNTPPNITVSDVRYGSI